MEKIVLIDQITINENGYVMIREATRVIDNGSIIAQTYHRSSLSPGQDISNQPDNVQAICRAVWTPEIIQAHQDSLLKVEG